MHQKIFQILEKTPNAMFNLTRAADRIRKGNVNEGSVRVRSVIKGFG